MSEANREKGLNDEWKVFSYVSRWFGLPLSLRSSLCLPSPTFNILVDDIGRYSVDHPDGSHRVLDTVRRGIVGW